MTPLRLLVLGATGGIGRLVVAQALARGDTVTALVRSPPKLATKHDKLTVLEGSPLEPSHVERALDGTDAVLSTLGHTDLGPSTLVTDAARVLARAMKHAGPSKLAIVSTTLVLPGGGVLTRLPKWITRHALADSSAMEAFLRTTDLDWTSLRLVRLTNGDKADYATFDGPASVFEHLPRASAAACLLDVVHDGSFARRAFGVKAAPRSAGTRQITVPPSFTRP